MLGYDVPLADLERSLAAAQELDDDELDAISGGAGTADSHTDWCMGRYYCYTAFLHTDDHTTDHNRACWSDYKCMIKNK